MSDQKNRNRILGPGVAAGLAVLLSGCADYMNHRDSVTLAAGDAMYANRGVHVDNPFPPGRNAERITSDGKRAATVIEGYEEKAEAPVPPQPLQVILSQEQ